MQSAIICALMALTMNAAMAADDTRSANYILSGCKYFLENNVREKIVVQGLCIGMVSATSILARSFGLHKLHSKEQREVCLDIPPGVTPEQEIRVVVSYIEARPSRMHEQFVFLALEAMLGAWSCRN